MPEVDWHPSRSLVNTLKTHFPFIYAGEPTIWTIRDITVTNPITGHPLLRHFSPSLMRSYNLFDAHIRNFEYDHTSPVGYSEFAHIFNAHADHTPYGYSYWDSTKKMWIVPPHKHISFSDLDLLEFALAVPPGKNTALMGMGLADANGQTNDDMVANMTKATFSRMIREENEGTMQDGYGPLRSIGRNSLRRGKAKPYDQKADRKEGTGNGNLTTGTNTPVIHPSNLANPHEDFSLMELDDYSSVFSPITPSTLSLNNSASSSSGTSTVASVSQSTSNPSSSSTSTTTTKPVEDTSSKSNDK